MVRVNTTRTCASCGLPIEWRRKWADCWDEVRYCSARCRKRRLRAIDRRLEESIVDLLAGRQTSLCPSEVARAVGGDAAEHWRALMEPVRCAARRLNARQVVSIQQGGKTIADGVAKGPIRILRGALFDSAQIRHD